ncbi:hypothetical protein ACIB24_16985 [Spongisporangium articulatum]|uniref:DUF805 domain-containing protein n=1 Tax=Spongisporangium articulatum TaxID=3362603 RepID=A0ABW8AT40_9ACTN
MRTRELQTPPASTIVGLVLVVLLVLPHLLELLTLVLGLGSFLHFVMVVLFAAAGAFHLWAARNLWWDPAPRSWLLVVALLAVWPLAAWENAAIDGGTTSLMGALLIPVAAAGLFLTTPSRRFANVAPPTGTRVA